MSHLSEQREFFNGLTRAAKQVVQEMNAEAAARRAARPAPRPVKRRDLVPVSVDFEPSESCQCHNRVNPPCSWCTSDDNPLNADGGQTP